METKINTKPSKIVIFISIILILVNSFISFVLGGGSVAYLLGNVFLLPLVVIVISSLFKVYRNWRSRWLIILNTMLIVLLSLFGNFISNISHT
jgi:hypothetical protein